MPYDTIWGTSQPTEAQEAAYFHARRVRPVIQDLFPGCDLGFRLRGEVQRGGPTFGDQQRAAKDREEKV